MDRPVAVITGAAKGLGSAVAGALHRSGYRVCINYLSSGGAAGELAASLGEDAMAMRADVGIRAETDMLVQEVIEKWGRLDVMVCNAGVTKDALLIKQSEEDWDRIMAVNLKGAFNAVRAAAPLMREGGHIIFISSYSGLKGKPGQAAYSASKAALGGLMKTAAKELAQQGIRVNTILPGYMATDMGSTAAYAMEGARQESLLQTLSDPGEVASFIAFLVSTRTVTGQTFIFDSRII